jgi:hypothetical protein
VLTNREWGDDSRDRDDRVTIVEECSSIKGASLGSPRLNLRLTALKFGIASGCLGVKHEIRINLVEEKQERSDAVKHRFAGLRRLPRAKFEFVPRLAVTTRITRS